MPPKKGGSKDQRNGGFIFAAFGPTTDKPRAFNIECTSAYLYDQIKEVVFASMETFARGKDLQLRTELAALQRAAEAHARHEPKRDCADEGQAPSGGAGGDTRAVGDEALGGTETEEADPFEVAHDLWCAEEERLQALVSLREKQQAQLLGGLAGFKDLASLGAKLELRDGDGDAVPFPMTSEPLLPASDILEHKKLYRLWRKDLASPPASDEGPGSEPVLSTVPLFFELDPEPGDEYGRPEQPGPPA